MRVLVRAARGSARAKTFFKEMNVKFRRLDLGGQNGKSKIDKKLSGICKNNIYVFCSSWEGFSDENNFGQHLLTKVLPKNGFSHKIPLKMTQFRGGDKLMGVFCVLWFGGSIFG